MGKPPTLVCNASNQNPKAFYALSPKPRLEPYFRRPAPADIVCWHKGCPHRRCLDPFSRYFVFKKDVECRVWGAGFRVSGPFGTPPEPLL